jgi:predicted Zn-dependent protease
MMLEQVEQDFQALLPAVDYCSLRLVDRSEEHLTVRRDVAEPVSRSHDVGAMVTVIHEGGLGYAATSRLDREGLRDAIRRAADWARNAAPHMVSQVAVAPQTVHQDEYHTPVSIPWASVPIGDKFDRLQAVCAALGKTGDIVDRTASLWHSQTETLHLSSAGGRVFQSHVMLSPDMRVTAHRNGESQSRSLGSRGESQSGGLEVLDRIDFDHRPATIAEQALELLSADNCPSGATDLVLAPDQMILQIHESIGHPLELDRILGDERNYAGTSFVTPDMFGAYQYGSDLLNVTFDPTRPEELASYGFDDEGSVAERVHLIRDGRLERPLGSAASARRSGFDGVANARATSWNRPPIDRMANLNLEPGTQTFEELLGDVERGVYMETNLSWSIDDSRNKFQFGCEWARLIRNGELGPVVKNPNYRGISATFWRSLEGVGNADTLRVLGTPFCGKGEPNQVIRVGHASPTCRFGQVDVFGGQ